jgi:hypothetical protein
MGPTAKIEYVVNDRAIAYWDASYFSKDVNGGDATIYNSDGMPIATAAVTNKFRYIYNQIGFKALLGGDFSEKKTAAIPWRRRSHCVLYHQVCVQKQR